MLRVYILSDQIALTDWVDVESSSVLRRSGTSVLPRCALPLWAVRCVLSRVARFFFYQAEDGIRDWSVTGVQTCALPISSVRPQIEFGGPAFCYWHARRRGDCDVAPYARCHSRPRFAHSRHRRRVRAADRSEERRVGKECRSRWSPYH